MACDRGQLTPRDLRHRNPEEVKRSIQSNDALMQQLKESLEYFDNGGPGIPWDETKARAKPSLVGRLATFTTVQIADGAEWDHARKQAEEAMDREWAARQTMEF